MDCASVAADCRADSIIFALGSTPTTRLKGVSSVVAWPIKPPHTSSINLLIYMRICRTRTRSASKIHSGIPSSTFGTLMILEHKIKQLSRVSWSKRRIHSCIKGSFSKCRHGRLLGRPWRCRARYLWIRSFCCRPTPSLACTSDRWVHRLGFFRPIV